MIKDVRKSGGIGLNSPIVGRGNVFRTYEIKLIANKTRHTFSSEL